MLIEMLFGIIFFLFPVVAMFIAVIAKGLCSEDDIQEVEGVGIKRKKVASLGGSALVHNKVMAYQLIESKMHEPLIIRCQKRGSNLRAGP